MQPAKGQVQGLREDGTSTSIDVQYNPNSLTLRQEAEASPTSTIPGLDAPLKQFVRGEAETLTVELFFDTTEQGTGAGATSVTELTDPFYGLVKIDPQTHAPPICSFIWGKKFPGDSLPERYKNQRRTEFKGVVTDVKQDFKLFSPEGTPLRALLTLTLDEYRPLHQQLQAAEPACPPTTPAAMSSSAATRSPLVAWLHLDDAASLARTSPTPTTSTIPRRLEPGRTLLVPPLT